MSFQDIESGLVRSEQSSSISPQLREDSTFLSLQSSISLQVFKINSNVGAIRTRVDQLGTTRDSDSLRKSLRELTETTRGIVKQGSEDLKKLASMAMTRPQHKTSVQKTSNDLQQALKAFQRAQQLSVERQKTVVKKVTLAVETEYPNDTQRRREFSASPWQHQAQLLQPALSPHELVYQESLIQEREAGIQQIESGIHELSEVWSDLGTLVNQQGGMLDNIESNVYSIAVDTQGATDEVSTASDYQRKAGRCAACLMIILIVVIAAVLFATLA